MTATVVFDLVEEMAAKSSFARLQSLVLILQSAADLVGTSAQLIKDDLLTVEELLYGMMLPSGNDAAESLAMYFGSLILSNGQLDPNKQLVDISDQFIKERIEGYRQGTYPPKINENESVEQRRKRHMERYDIWQQSRYYDDSESIQEKAVSSLADYRNTSNQASLSTADSSDTTKLDQSQEKIQSLEQQENSPTFDLLVRRATIQETSNSLQFDQQINSWEEVSEGQISEEEEKIPTDFPFAKMQDADLRKRVILELIKEKERQALKAFYKRMNETSNRIGCSKKTNFAVAHGMHHDRNWSTAIDIASISCYAIRNHCLLAEVINTKKFECRSRINSEHTYRWKNTNEMLWDSSKCYFGVKTGVTQTAGPCLAVHYKSGCGVYDFIIVVLNAKNKEARFLEIPKLVEWAIQKIQRVKKINYKPSLKRQLLRNLAHF